MISSAHRSQLQTAQMSHQAAARKGVRQESARSPEKESRKGVRQLARQPALSDDQRVLEVQRESSLYADGRAGRKVYVFAARKVSIVRYLGSGSAWAGSAWWWCAGHGIAL